LTVLGINRGREGIGQRVGNTRCDQGQSQDPRGRGETWCVCFTPLDPVERERKRYMCESMEERPRTRASNETVRTHTLLPGLPCCWCLAPCLSLSVYPIRRADLCSRLFAVLFFSFFLFLTFLSLLPTHSPSSIHPYRPLFVSLNPPYRLLSLLQDHPHIKVLSCPAPTVASSSSPLPHSPSPSILSSCISSPLPLTRFYLFTIEPTH